MKKMPPYSFVLDRIERLQPVLKPMFGAWGVYANGKMLFILRERESYPQDNGIWLATFHEHHESLRKELPTMRAIELFSDGGPTQWQNIPVDGDDFEGAAEKVCELVLRGDLRIGKETKGTQMKKKKPAVVKVSAKAKAKTKVPKKKAVAPKAKKKVMSPKGKNKK